MHKMIVRILMGVFILLNTISLPSVMHFFGELSYPGYQSTDLNDLHPDFRRKLTKVIAHLESEGYPVWVGSTWRDTERQQFYKDKGYSDTMDSLHRGGGEKAGTRRSKAADIYLLLPMIYLPVHAHFYNRLNAVSKKEGLYTGANFSKKKGSVWTVFGLGWDPGHVQVSPPKK